MSNRLNLVFAFAALMLPLGMGACASTPKPVAVAQPVEMYAPPPPPPPAEFEVAQYGGASYHGAQRTEILSQLPDNAPPGECYARVKVPGTGMAALPQAPGARWVQNPGPPGSPGPIWCLEPTGPAPIAFEPEQYGFIRVLCDDDATPGRIVNIQQKLHEGGYYQGGYTGRYDAATAQAVTRFQGAHHLNHGGYLSVDTVRQIEGPTTVVVAPRITVSPKITVSAPPAQPAYPQPPIYQQPIYAPPVMQPPMMQPPMYPQPIMAPPVLYPQAGYASYQTSYGAGGYGYGGAAVSAAASASASGGAAAAAAAAGAGGYAAPYYGTSGYGGYGDGWWAGPGYPGGVGSYPQLPYPLPYQNYGPGPAAWPAPGFGPQGYPRPAYNAPRSAVQSGWLNWSGKSYF